MNKQLIEAVRTAVDALDGAAQLAFHVRSCEFHVDASKYSECSELLRAALEAAQREQGRARLTADVVEQRLLTWRQRSVNRSGDQLALDDFMDQRSIDDLVDFVCAEDTPPPGVLDALREQAQDEHDAVRIMRTVIDKGHRYVLVVEPCDGSNRMQMDSGMRRIEVARMLERFAREAREDARLGGDE